VARWWKTIGQGLTLVAILAILAFVRIPTLDARGRLVPNPQAEHCRVPVAKQLMAPWLRMVGTVKTLAKIGATVLGVEMVPWAVSRWLALLSAGAKLGRTGDGEQTWWMNTASRTVVQQPTVNEMPHIPGHSAPEIHDSITSLELCLSGNVDSCETLLLGHHWCPLSWIRIGVAVMQLLITSIRI